MNRKILHHFLILAIVTEELSANYLIINTHLAWRSNEIDAVYITITVNVQCLSLLQHLRHSLIRRYFSSNFSVTQYRADHKMAKDFSVQCTLLISSLCGQTLCIHLQYVCALIHIHTHIHTYIYF